MAKSPSDVAESEASYPKRCFVTIGATAPFDSLLKAVFEPKFLQALHTARYTELRVQYGKEGRRIFEDFVARHGSQVWTDLTIEVTGFDFDQNGLEKEMHAAKGSRQNQRGVDPTEGTVISHAGSGSILDAMRFGIPLIVVPNSELLHNHQVELAEELAKQQYVVHGKLEDLAGAIPEIEQLRTRMQKWPPINSGEEKYRKGLAGIMDEEMGWID